MKIDILIPDFADFGAQRVAINAANGLAKRHEVRLVVNSVSGPFRGYVGRDVEVVALDDHVPAIAKIRVILRFLAYRRIVRRGSWVVSYSPVMNVAGVVAGLCRRDVRVAVQEHGLVSAVLKDKGAYGPVFSVAYRWAVLPLYRLADHFIVITDAIREDLVRNFGFGEAFFSVLRNPLDLEGIAAMAKKPLPRGPWSDRQFILGMGRICTQKDFVRLVDAFGALAADWPDVDLVIVGKGDLGEKARIEAQAVSLDIAARVHFAGFQANPYAFMARARAFCMTSLWEGLPQVLAEAMACGVPVVAHDCPSGPAEMVLDGNTGFVPMFQDRGALVHALERCLKRGKEIDGMVSRARKWVRREYALKRYVQALVAVLERTEGGGGEIPV